jgi:lysophospholipase L1-like esterase
MTHLPALAALMLPPALQTLGAQPVDAPVIHEQYEWSNIWWDHANDAETPRVLLIGDSISCGYSGVVTNRLEGKVRVDRLGTSRSLNDPVLLKETEIMLAEHPYAAIHFNNGLHGFHLTGPQYGAALKAYLDLLEAHKGAAKLIWGSSTPITESGKPDTLAPSNEVVISRNALAAELMASRGIPINDLYALASGKPDLRSGDGYHYTPEGYEVLGQAVSEALRPHL